MSTQFTIWLLPYLDWKDSEIVIKNDPPLVAAEVQKILPTSYCDFSLNVCIREVAVNMYAVDNAIEDIKASNSYNLVIGIGVASGVGNPLVRFECGGDKVNGLNGRNQYDERGHLVPRNQIKSCETTFSGSDGAPLRADWYNKRNPFVLNSILSNTINSEMNAGNGDYDYSCGVSLDAGDYMCEYMSASFAKDHALSGNAFFIHVADLRRSQDDSKVVIRMKEVQAIYQFILEQVEAASITTMLKALPRVPIGR